MVWSARVGDAASPADLPPAEAGRPPPWLILEPTMAPLWGRKVELVDLQRHFAPYQVTRPWPPNYGDGYARDEVADADGQPFLTISIGCCDPSGIVEVLTPVVATERGIRVGSRVAELFAAYPGAACKRYRPWRGSRPYPPERDTLACSVVLPGDGVGRRLVFSLPMAAAAPWVAERGPAVWESGDEVPQQGVDPTAEIAQITMF
jgi:hypothetical protein